MSLRNGLLVFCAAALAMWSGLSPAAPVDQATDLSFRTRGQSLFGPNGGATGSASLRFDVLNQKNDLLRKGRIVNTQVPLSLAATQAIWQKAINTCTNVTYTLRVAGVTIFSVSPSQTECINGEIRRNYCIAPPSPGWSACVDIGDNRQTWVVNLGPGIGSKPTSGTTRAYDFGAIVSMSSDLRVGFEGSYEYDLGSVDVDYSARATLHFDRDRAAPGEVVTITSGHTDQSPYVMNSRYPSFELALDMYAFARMSIDAEYAGVNQTNGDPVRSTRNLYSLDSRDNPDAIDGFMPFTDGSERLFGIRLDTNGVTRTILGATDRVDARYDYTLTWPLRSPEAPGKKAPKFTMPISFSLLEFTFTAPKLDTPAPVGFDCGVCVPLRNQVTNGVLSNTSPVGGRTLIGGITDGDGWTLPFVNDGMQDTDIVRMDVDLDAVTLAFGAPLGAIVADPLGILEAEVNLLDLDLANFISADQALRFDPRLRVELRFSKPTEVLAPGAADFVLASSLVVPVGEAVQFRQPSGGVTITPVYTLRENRFTNDTRLKLGSAIQETLGQVKLGGYVGDGMASLIGEDPNFAMLQLTPELYDPRDIWSNDATPFKLDGFADQTAKAIKISATGAGGGGGSWDAGSLFALLLGSLLLARRRLRANA